VCLEFISWLCEGSTGLHEFSGARNAMALDGAYDGTFFSVLTTNEGRRYVVMHEGVSAWARHLCQNPSCSNIIRWLLDLVEFRMLRVNAED